MGKPKTYKSPWKNLMGEEPKPEGCFREIAKPYIPVDSIAMAASAVYAAYPSASGGGAIHYHKIDKPSRGAFKTKACTGDNGHTMKVNDLDFSPFDDALVATGSLDCTVKLTRLGDYEKKEESTVELSLEGHEKQVLQVKWHPSAQSILATASQDKTVKLWNTDTEQKAFQIGIADKPFSMCWSNNGQYLAVTTKAKDFLIQDPRTDKPLAHLKGCFESTKASRCFFADNVNLVGSSCYNKSAKRLLKFWDMRKLDQAPVYDQEVDSQSSVIFPQYDPDTFTLYTIGRGEGSIGCYHLINDEVYLWQKNTYSTNVPQRGGCLVPKRAVDVGLRECSRILKLTDKAVIPVSFRILRKQPGFQAELYPDAFLGAPACNATEYVEGHENLACVTGSMNPKKRQDPDSSNARKPYAVLAKENEELKARIAELEAQVKSE